MISTIEDYSVFISYGTLGNSDFGITFADQVTLTILYGIYQAQMPHIYGKPSLTKGSRKIGRYPLISRQVLLNSRQVPFMVIIFFWFKFNSIYSNYFFWFKFNFIYGHYRVFGFQITIYMF